MMLSLRLQKSFGDAPDAPRIDVAMDIPLRGFATLYGESGAGKTSILRMIAGLAKPDAGFIKMGDEVWFDSGRGIDLPPQRRGVGFVFQDYALFPNMTVRGNLQFAAGNGAGKMIDRLVAAAGLEAYQHRMPRELSGGQQQRVALARALARGPKMLLLDEPLSALDASLRQQLQDELLAMHRLSGATTILVSHDISEVFKMSERVFMLEAGRITRQGAPMEMFGDQSLSGKFRFIGEVVAVEKQDIVHVVAVVVGNSVLRVMATASEVKDLRPGDRVLLLSKAFNPLIMKL